MQSHPCHGISSVNWSSICTHTIHSVLSNCSRFRHSKMVYNHPQYLQFMVSNQLHTLWAPELFNGNSLISTANCKLFTHMRFVYPPRMCTCLVPNIFAVTPVMAKLCWITQPEFPYHSDNGLPIIMNDSNPSTSYLSSIFPSLQIMQLLCIQITQTS